MNARIGDALKKSDLGKALNAAFGAAIDIYTAGGPDGCFVFSTAPPETSSSPLCRTILDRALETIDAQFLSRLELEGKRLTSTPADLEERSRQQQFARRSWFSVIPPHRQPNPTGSP